MDVFLTIKMTCAVVGTLGLYSVLYRENKFYRLIEHIFLGLAAGYTIVALWAETLGTTWYDKMMGTPGENPGDPNMPGFWAYAVLLPLGFMGYFVFSKKHNWLSKIPIGIILGLYAGQQINAWWNRYGPQIRDSMKPILPTTTDSFFVPADKLPNVVYPSQALSNLIFVITILTVLSYFLFSVDIKNKLLQKSTMAGRLFLMIGFGAIFGSTVLMRFTLLIDRMYFIWIEWFKNLILPIFLHK